MGDDGKIGLSMKHVNQGNGTDLDPNGVKQQLDDQRRKTFVPRERQAIKLDAVLDTTCKKCGTVGHLAKDCFMPADGKRYALIPEIEDEAPTVPDVQAPTEKKHKSKKIKKKKKKSSHKHDSDSESDDSKEDKKIKKRKKHSKDHKRKKKRDSSLSESDSDSDSKPKKKKSSTGESSERHSKKCKRSKSKYSD